MSYDRFIDMLLPLVSAAMLIGLSVNAIRSKHRYGKD